MSDSKKITPTIECTLEEYANHVKEFILLLPKASKVSEVENMVKAVNLAYLGCTDMFESKINEIKAAHLYEYSNTIGLRRMGELLIS